MSKRPLVVDAVEPNKDARLGDPSIQADIDAANEHFALPVDTWVSEAKKPDSGKSTWVSETPLSRVMEPEVFINEWADKIYFDECKNSSDRMRYLMIPLDKKPTKSVHLIFKGRSTGTSPIVHFEAKKDMQQGFAANVTLTDDEYEFFKRGGAFTQKLCAMIVAQPQKVLGANHKWVKEISDLIAKDEEEMNKLLKSKDKLLKICETEEERELERADIDARIERFRSHSSSIDLIMSKYRSASQVKPVMERPEKTPLPASWKCKINSTSSMYPAMTIYKIEDDAPKLVYHQDKDVSEPSRFATPTQLENHRKSVELWEQKHREVVEAHPDGAAVSSVIPSYSKVTWIVSILGLSIMDNTIDITTRITQAIVVGDPESFASKPIGEPTPCLWQPDL